MLCEEADPENKASVGAELLLSFFAVTLPGMMLRALLFYLLACPCLRYEQRGRRGECDCRRARGARDAAALAAGSTALPPRPLP